MSWLIAGSVPKADFPLTWGKYRLRDNVLDIDGMGVNVARGTPALMAVAAVCAEVLGMEAPEALLAGDVGTGDGSRALYKHLAENVERAAGNGVTFHYLLPDIYWHNQVLWGLEGLSTTPLLVADAGYMYAAKMSGFAGHYDLFTPDAGEMAFLADETAPHPFYTRGFLLQEEDRVPELIRLAYAGENAARYLLVKGKRDYIVAGGKIIAEVEAPDVPAMEPIGGTGDSLTGLVTALLASGMEMAKACRTAALANRYLGLFSHPSPAHGIADLLPFLPKALERALEETGG
ncbi:Carbohydrate kinase [Desulfonatronum thiosulfatophilum]|uniref:Carbohydrate kinase n=1 Tax=Desulfonatronum thiosulfatophilum TaxID=617002 RepID=A0A1G6EUS4_9BACT|nr:NAD(P)H-hydrate dehydratase [Desulfonatronum thiosulfatophilum]SDB61224.1 Carbohydrate kinase [Desulfonatronum thiosulfatophilum]